MSKDNGQKNQKKSLADKPLYNPKADYSYKSGGKGTDIKPVIDTDVKNHVGKPAIQSKSK